MSPRRCRPAGGRPEGLDMEGPREECGVVAVASPGGDAATTVFYGLFALQHRGQEAAGIAAWDGRGLSCRKDLGLVSQVFKGGSLDELRGGSAVGHTRYSTTGSSSVKNAQPILLETRHGPLALAHNGNLTNAPGLRRALLDRGFGLSTSSDTEILAMTLAAAEGPDWPARIAGAMASWEGAYSLVLQAGPELYAMRDPWGVRPLALGLLPDGGAAAASETSALRVIGCEAIIEVGPGEIYRLGPEGYAKAGGLAPRAGASCSFEYVYFSRPDSVWNGRSVHASRRRAGELLAGESPAKADIVVPVPDSSIPAAIGYAIASGIPYEEGFVKNRYIGRTFIEPTPALRKRGVALKFSVLPETVGGKRVVLVDDSVVRGTTTAPLVSMLRAAGATEVHIRVASPPIRHPCYMGVDMGSAEGLLARGRNEGEMAARLGADSLAYLSVEGLGEAIGRGIDCCGACFTGRYPIEPEAGSGKGGFEGGLA